MRGCQWNQTQQEEGLLYLLLGSLATRPMPWVPSNDYERSISDRLITIGDTSKILQSKMSRMRGSDLCVGQQSSIGACVKGKRQGMFESFSRILPHWAERATSTWSELRSKPAQLTIMMESFIDRSYFVEHRALWR